MAKEDGFIPNVKGVSIELSGKEYILPPLPVRAYSKGDASAKIQKIQEALLKMQSNKNAIMDIPAEVIGDLISLVTMALKRNYPDMAEDTVEDGVYDIMSLMSMFQYLITQDEAVIKATEAARKNALREFVEKQAKKI